MAKLPLPDAPSDQAGPVKAWSSGVVIPTYAPLPPERHPMFLERRVYQGSSGKVYPLPVTDRIDVHKATRTWQAMHIENEFLRVMVLPELGGRIHLAVDKSNGYDLIYRQDVIKPALVGLAGPWVSGGIEFNWPQHHRPATFLPVDAAIEEHPDGSKTIWCSDHDPICRMKGMHGVCLRPHDAAIELKVRVFNRTPWVQTFLWWANVATRVHERYQSFFPPDVYFVADHARRAMTRYPLADGIYYGVNYGERGRSGMPAHEAPSQFIPSHCRSDRKETEDSFPNYAANDLRFYANIPTPCSYMCLESRQDFLGGYDYLADAGIVHVANHHIAPGKKQWTWGNHNFGYAWDRNLTEPDSLGECAPYIEIMAGVYTDNQPDFSFLFPGETKTWSQYWYPIQKIGPVQSANRDAAISLRLNGKKQEPEASIGACVTRRISDTTVELSAGKRVLAEWKGDLAPGEPLMHTIRLDRPMKETELRLRISGADSTEVISYDPCPRSDRPAPPPADEPLAPHAITSSDELFLVGLHLEQYRHATRSPTSYWLEALRRDPLDSRCNNAMGRWHLRRGEFVEAQEYFEHAIKRLTERNANPYDTEAFYNLGLCLRYQNDLTPNRSAAALEAAYGAFYKATWTQPWAAAGYHAVAEIDCREGRWHIALDHVERSLRLNADNLSARNLKVMVLRQLKRLQESQQLLDETRSIDRMDWWTHWLAGEVLQCDLQVKLDLAHDLARAGFYRDAIDVLKSESADSGSWPSLSWGAKPLIHYTLGWLHEQMEDSESARAEYQRAATIPVDYCFPARLEEIGVLEAARRANPQDAKACYYVGNLLYDRRRHKEAIQLWRCSAALEPNFSIVWRNLGIGYFNVLKSPRKARAAYDKAFRADQADARLLYERDQLWKRLHVSPARRLRALKQYPDLVAQRDDLSLELSTLLNQVSKHREALSILQCRQFQPWEGGEGGPLGQYVRANLALGQADLANDDTSGAVQYFQAALAPPKNLSEASHLLANQSDVHYWLGMARYRAGERRQAKQHWKTAAENRNDFQEMSVRNFSEKTYYSAVSLVQLGRAREATKLLKSLLAYAQKLAKLPTQIDYFATSLPTMLLFEDDLDHRQKTTAMFLQAQAHLGLGDGRRARSLLTAVLKREPNHAPAADLSSELAVLRSLAIGGFG